MLDSDPMRRGRVRRLEREQATRERVLDAAEIEFAIAGFEEARIHAIAERARVAFGTLYGLYAGKHELYEGVQERRLDALFVHVATAILEPTSAIDAIREGLRALIQFHCAHPDYLAMHLRDGQAWSTTSHLRTEVQRTSWSRGMELMRSLFARAAAEGAIPSGHADRDARVAIAAHQVFMAEWLESTERAPPEQLFEATWELLERAFAMKTTGPKEAAR